MIFKKNNDVFDKLNQKSGRLKDDNKAKLLKIKNAQKEFNRNFKNIKKTYSKKIYDAVKWMNSNLKDEYSCKEWELEFIESERNGYIFEITGPITYRNYANYREGWHFHFFLTSFGPFGSHDTKYWIDPESKISCFASVSSEEYDLNRITYYRGSDFETMIEKFMDELVRKHAFYLSRN